MMNSINTFQQTKATWPTNATRSQWADDLGAGLANKTQAKTELDHAIAELPVLDDLAIKAALGAVNGLIWGLGVLPKVLKLGSNK
jgi:hypothetical protein